ncbi:MAG: hypothetical protein RTU09_09680 [Candidatus Thorarchaeota archaeon]
MIEMDDDILGSILFLLRNTKDSSALEVVDRRAVGILESLGLNRELDDSWIVSRRNRIALAFRAVALGSAIETVVELLTWKDFEGFVAEILEENDFHCVESFRRRGNGIIKGMEIDVVGVRGKTIVSIDAKMWGIRSGKSSALARAAEKQKERTARLANQMNRLAQKLKPLPNGSYSLVPIIVTWMVENIEFHEGVPVIPVFKLNSFILDLQMYDGMYVTFEGIQKA